MAPRGPDWPGAADEVSGQADMEQQHMKHITQETTRRWYARVLSVFIEVLLPSVYPPRSSGALAADRMVVGQVGSRGTPLRGGCRSASRGLTLTLWTFDQATSRIVAVSITQHDQVVAMYHRSCAVRTETLTKLH